MTNTRAGKGAEYVQLGTFVEENQKLIAVVGVLMALTLFCGQVRYRMLGGSLSVLFLGMAVLVWLELVRRLPARAAAARRVRYFARLATIAFALIGCLWALELHRVLGRAGITVALMVPAGGVVAWVTLKAEVFEKLEGTELGRRKRVGALLREVLIAAMVVASFLLASVCTTPFERVILMANKFANASSAQAPVRITGP